MTHSINAHHAYKSDSTQINATCCRCGAYKLQLVTSQPSKVCMITSGLDKAEQMLVWAYKSAETVFFREVRCMHKLCISN